MLAMTDEMLQNTEDFTATLGSLTITQKVTFEDCTVIGEGENRIYWPEEGKTGHYTMDSASRKTDKNWNRRAVRRVRTAPFICTDENIPNKTGNLSKNDDAICHVLLYNKVIIGKSGRQTYGTKGLLKWTI